MGMRMSKDSMSRGWMGQRDRGRVMDGDDDDVGKWMAMMCYG